MLKELISRRQRKKTLKGFGTAQAVQNDLQAPAASPRRGSRG
jgi:hypothetical protein